MAITNWYLNIDRLPQFPDEVIDYLEGLKPHKAALWDKTNKEMAEYKSSLLEQLAEIQDNRCAYCGLSLDWNLVDREHFVHKGQLTGYPEFMFNLKNLFAACGFCNRRIKGQGVTLQTYNENYDECVFCIIHPFFDTPENEIEFLELQQGQHILVKALTPKGQSTIDFFLLSDKRLTVRRAGFIAERELEAEMDSGAYAELKLVSYYRPD
ncbi:MULTISPECIES: HNH endonuclease [Pseudomonas syringae group]|uniref:HNH endonuclease n=2 Tax=Pseudomonas avellanae TaxID=46257 RepID=A0AAD0GLU5_9PSED|nr:MULTISPECIES: HNH endonuclease [Pseudomonas syringae group]AVB18498.1 HNH endonuclease [Pseudomonas avellanae]EGH11770.1 hypothetical protein PSYMP_18597 [Pseudomonas amygdali pv. morsprunorum str. M302280]KWS70533.1 hypothetical protein AL055_15030 [Pseudomonas amygdali pv. morsprunorum]PHN34495.1 hypothetical protein AO261_01655 [Pseudomonas avellanae]POC82154.1 HNH endonuclease [Pseudomonas avellanae]